MHHSKLSVHLSCVDFLLCTMEKAFHFLVLNFSFKWSQPLFTVPSLGLGLREKGTKVKRCVVQVLTIAWVSPGSGWWSHPEFPLWPSQTTLPVKHTTIKSNTCSLSGFSNNSSCETHNHQIKHLQSLTSQTTLPVKHTTIKSNTCSLWLLKQLFLWNTTIKPNICSLSGFSNNSSCEIHNHQIKHLQSLDSQPTPPVGWLV